MKWFTLACFMGAAAAALFGTGIVSLNHPPPGAVFEPIPTVAPAPRRIFAAGVVEGAQREAALGFELPGRIKSIHVEEGQTVSAGDVLADLDDTLWQQKVCEAEAQLQLAVSERERLVNGERQESREVARAAAQLAAVRVLQAEADKQRAENLFAKQAMSQEQYDRFRFQYDLAAAEYKQARAKVAEIEAAARDDDVRMADAKVKLAETAVQQAQTMLGKTKLAASCAGTVLRIDVEPGELMSVEHPQPALVMADVQHLRVRAWVEELDALSLSVGQTASLLADGRPDVRYSGTITWIAPLMGPKQQRHHRPGEHVDVKVREVLIALEESADLVVGLPVEVFIENLATDVSTMPLVNSSDAAAASADPMPSNVSIVQDPRDQTAAPEAAALGRK